MPFPGRSFDARFGPSHASNVDEIAQFLSSELALGRLSATLPFKEEALTFDDGIHGLSRSARLDSSVLAGIAAAPRRSLLRAPEYAEPR